MRLSLSHPSLLLSNLLSHSRHFSIKRQLVALTLIAALWTPTLALANSARNAGRRSPAQRKTATTAPSSNVSDNKLNPSLPSPTAQKAAPTRDSRGTDFWLTALNAGDASTLSLLITSDADTTGEVAVPGSGYTASFSFTAGTSATVEIPAAAAALANSDVVESKAIHITAQQEISVYQLNRFQNSSETYLALPTDALGTEYLALNYSQKNSVGDTYFAVAATTDETTLTITPSVSTGSRTAGIPFDIKLNQGQTYQLRSDDVNGGDLTGSVINSDKPVAVFSGYGCGNQPINGGQCAHGVQQLPSTDTWGKSFAVLPLATRDSGDTFRFLAATDETHVSVNGSEIATLNRGQFYEQFISGAAHIISDQPITVARYSTGAAADGSASGQLMMLVTPSDEFSTDYIVTTPAGGFYINYVNVVASDAALGSIKLDGASIPTSRFVPLASSSLFGAQIEVSPGTHRLSGQLPFDAYLYGFAQNDAYGYNGGMTFASSPQKRTKPAAKAQAMPSAQAASTACQLYPIALSATSLSGVTAGNAINDIYNGTQPGNFGWLTWAGSPNVPTLVKSLTPPGDSSTYVNPDDSSDKEVSVGDWVQGKPGVSNSSNVRSVLDELKSTDITVPVWNQTRGQGNNANYRVSAFARVRLLSYQLPGQNRISARFLGYVQCPIVANQPPTVDAGLNQTITLPNAAQLNGTASDDGLPVGSTLTTTWSKVTGPGSVTFANPNVTVTTASFSAPGTYVLRLTASDSQLSAASDVTITVVPANQPPQVNAGADQIITLPNAANLTGTVSDDGLPQGGALTTNWDKISGPGTVVFTNPHAPTTTVNFSAAGTYVLRLSASDSQLTASDDLVVTVNPENQPPTANAGADQTITLPGNASLNGTVTDDGLPVGSSVSSVWTKVSGPGTVTFGNPNVTVTSASFSMAGTYVLRITASDSQLTDSDEVTIVVDPANQPPVVNAGPNQTITLPAAANLNGTVSDDGLPVGDTLTTLWSVVSGPGTVTFDNPNVTVTTATFSVDGVYVLRLSASDSQLTNSSDVTITVNPPINQAPVVNAGTDHAFVLPCSASLHGTASDDGLPTGGTLTVAWSKVSGPGIVTFADPNALITTATFSAPGAYVLRLTVSDSALTSNDDVAVTVNVIEVGASQFFEATPLPYLSFLDSPLGGRSFTYFHLENFEDHQLNTPGVSANTGGVTSIAFGSGLHDSVDGDDGVIDGKGLNGDSYFAGNGASGITFTFDAGVLGSLPTHAGIVWTDGAGQVFIEAFDSNGVSMGTRGPYNFPDNVIDGTTAEDRLLGAYNKDGISAIKIRNTSGGIEVDHLQYGFAPPNGAPTVNAGADQDVILPANTVTLSGAVADDGLPACSTTTFSWSVVSAPGAVTFADEHALSTTATLSGAGTYVLRLTATDLQFTISDDVTVVVKAPANRPPVIISQAVTELALGATTGEGQLVNLPAWSVVQYEFNSQPDADWIFDVGNTVATQIVNADASILVGDFNLANDQMEGTWRVNSNQDDDFVGFVFGYQDAQHYYLFDWKKLNQDDPLGMAERGMSVKVVNADSPTIAADLWPTAGNANRVRTLFHNNIPWEEFTDYKFTLEFHPGMFTITVKRGDVVLEAVTLVDNTYRSGRFGFYNYSQEQVQYSGFRRKSLAEGNYLYNVVATDPDNDPLIYSLTLAPAGMSIDPATGRINWTATAQDFGNHDVTVKAQDPGGLFDTQSYVLNVTAQNRAPVVNAGRDLTTDVLSAADIHATVSDDGLPGDGALTASWTKVSGPGTVNFVNPNQPTTKATFSLAGAYVLRLTASDAQLSTSDDVTINVNESPYGLTASPSTVTVGSPITVNWHAPVGRPVTDWIGLYKVGDPNTSYLTYQYTQGAPTGTVTFNAPATPGQYEFRYLLENGYTSIAKSNTVNVIAIAPTNQAPVVNAGPDQGIGLPNKNVGLFVNDLAGFNAASGTPPVVVDFDNVAAGTDITGTTLSGVTFNLGNSPSPSAPLIVVPAADTFTPAGFTGVINAATNKLPPTSGANVLSPGGAQLAPGFNPLLENDDLKITFAQPVSAVGFDILFQELDFFSGVGVTILDANGNVLYSNSNLPDGSGAGGGAPGGAVFFGFVSSRANIATIIIDEYDGNADFPDANIGFDTFRVKRIIPAIAAVNLSGTVSDDGLPTGGALTSLWTKVNGPGTVTFDDPQQAATKAAFSDAGIYTLRLTGNDSQLTSSDEVTIAVNDGVVNNAPVVSAGADQVTTLAGILNLNGTATDDGIPAGSTLAISWSKLSGPGTVAFGNANATATTATFSAPGTYVLRLTANDSQLGAFDEVVVTVTNASNQAPSVNAGLDQTIAPPKSQVLFYDDFESGTGKWAIAGGMVLTTSSAYGGTHSQTFNRVTGGGDAHSILIPVTPGQVYYLHTAYRTLGGGGQIAAQYYDQSQQLVFIDPQIIIGDGGYPYGTTFDYSVLNTDPANLGVWKLYTQAITVAPGIYYVSINTEDWDLGLPNDPSGKGVFFDNIELSTSATPSSAGTALPTTTLSGAVTDDGLPIAGSLTTAWSKVSGPGNVTFENPNQATTKATFGANGIYALRLTASDTELSTSRDVTVTVAPASNYPPTVNAGADQLIRLPNVANLNGKVTDDGIPASGSPAVTWSKVTGPGTVTFSNPNAATTTAAFSVGGTYVLRLAASDSEFSTGDDVIVSVNPPNLPPVVNAGADQLIALPRSATLSGVVTDDGFPTPSVHIEWYKASGPGTVTFSNKQSATTNVSFSEPGSYILMLQGIDTQLRGYDLVTITVNPPGPNQAPEVSAGQDQIVPLNSAAQLNGSVTDDGLPIGQPVSVAWSKASGPGAVTFGNANALQTTAVFSDVGIYVLRLTANDSQLTNSSEVVVTVNPAGTAATYEQAVKAYAPGFYYRLGETSGQFIDLSGNNIPSTIQGSGMVRGVNGLVANDTDKAAQFNGATYVSILVNNNPQLMPANATLMCLFKPNVAGRSDLITFDAYDYWSFGRGFHLWVDQNMKLRAHWDQGGAAFTHVAGTTTLQVGQAYHVAAVSDGANISIYLNGQLEGSTTAIGSPSWGNAIQWQIGGNAQSGGPGQVYANGVIDEASLLGTALSPAQILTLANLALNSTPSNLAPVVNAGADQSVTFPAAATLNGTINDDGMPAGSSVSSAWSKVSGPGAVTFANPNVTVTTATFQTPGTYVLRLTASDTQLTGTDDVTVTVNALNQPPMVSAGANQTITLPAQATLNGTASDDGVPAGGALTLSWSQESGPGTTTFSQPNQAITTASFSAAGTYVLRLTANDGQLTSSSNVTIVVNAAGTNQPPTANAGEDKSVNINGNLLDNPGNEAPLAAGEIPGWTEVSGNSWTQATAGANGFPPSLQGNTYFYAGETATAELRQDVNLSAFAPGIAAGTQSFEFQASMRSGNEATPDVCRVVIEYRNASNTSLIASLDSGPIVSVNQWHLTEDARPAPPGTGWMRIRLVASRSTGTTNDCYFDALSLRATNAAAVKLNGATSDDGLPVGSTLSSAWTKVSGPGTVTFGNAATAVTSASFTAAGTYVLRLTASDSQLTASDEVTITVLPINQAPTVNAGSAQTITLPDSAALAGVISDDGSPAGSSVSSTWTKVSGPGTVSFDDASRADTHASFSAAGTYVLRLTATDSELSGSANVTITVLPQPVNQAPTANAGADQTIILPVDTVNLSGAATDDGLPTGSTLTLSWSKISGPGTVAFSNPNQANTTAQFSAAGSYVLRFTANDSQLTTSDDVTVIVREENATNQAPTVNAGADQTIPVTDSANLNGTVNDDGLPAGSSVSSTWTQVSGPGTVTFANPNVTVTTAVFSAAGTYVLRLTATDSELTANDELTVIVNEVTPPPTVAISSPEDATEITSKTNIIGSVSDGAWKLEYSLNSQDGSSAQTWTTFSTGSGAVVNGLLGTLDPTLLLNGTYSIRLTSTNAEGGISFTSIGLIVTGEQKVGNFTIAFKDVNVPVAGLPIQVIRTYDSRDKRKGDFGIGWTLGINNVRIEKTGVLGSKWEETVGGGFLPSYCLLAQRPRIVSIVFPDGKTYQFKAVTSPECQRGAPLQFATVAFTPMPGTQGSLAAVGQTDVVAVGDIPGQVELRNLGDLQLFNPTVFTLTTEDGTVYLLDQATGVKSVTDPNGNKLTIDSNGITHTSGKSIAFTRDAQGRITQISDPAGGVMTYTYDASGNLSSFKDQENNVTTFGYNSSHGLLTINDPRGIQPIRNEYDDNGRLLRHIDAFGKAVNYTHQLDTRQDIITDRLGNVTIHDYDANGNVLKTTDAQGNTTTFTYDSNDNKLSETNAIGKTTTYTYDAQNNKTSETDPLGNVTRYTYNSRKQVLTTTDPLGHVTTNTYDAGGNLISTKDPLGKTTEFTFNASGLPTTKTDVLGNLTRYEYDAGGNITKVTDALGQVTTYTYDANNNKLSETVSRTTATGTVETLTTTYQYNRLNQLVKTTQPDGTIKETVYNSNGQQSAFINQLGQQIALEYDPMGRVTRITFPNGAKQEATHDAEGRLLTTTDDAGHTTTNTYDSLGRLVKETYADGSFTTTTYDAINRVTAKTDERGNTTRYEYDPNCGCSGRRSKVIDALGNVTTYTYDGAGNQLTMTDASGRTTKYEHDANNRRTSVIYPDNTTETTVYDVQGKILSKTDQAGKTTQYEYDKVGRLVKTTDALNQITTFAYDETGNLISQTDANNHTTRFEYDKEGRRIKRILPLGMSESYTYDAAGRLLTKTDFQGKTTTYAYNALGRIIRKTPDPSLNQTTVTYTYAQSGKRATMTDATGTTTYTYDSRNRLTSKATPQGTLSYVYDPNGNQTGLSSSNANGVSVNYTYDTLNRLNTVVDNRMASGTTTYTYDTVGNLSGYLYPNGVQSNFTYDTLNRLTNVSTGNSTPLASYQYTLGAAGNRLSVAELNGRTVTYTYDALYRLTNETIANNPVNNGAVSYTYDPVGNRLSRNSTLAPVPNATQTFDDNDRLIGESYDANGNVTSSAGTAYAYDFEDRLSEVNSGAVAFIYDGDGNRVSKTVGGVTTKYLVDDHNPTGHPQVVEEVVGGTVQRVYTYGHSLISQSQIIGGQWKVSFYSTDGHGSVRLLTNDAGAVTDTYDFDAFGNLIAQTGTTPNEYLFSGEQLDANTGFYYLRARYMNPSTGRFQTMDTFEGSPFDPSSLHKYLYVGNDPVNKIDPSGHMALAGQLVGDAGQLAAQGGSGLQYATILAWIRYILMGIAAIGYAVTLVELIKKLDLPIPVSHYTPLADFGKIVLSGQINNPNPGGRNFFSPVRYMFGQEAREKLATCKQEDVRIDLVVFIKADKVTFPPTPVAPYPCTPPEINGGGWEMWNAQPVPLWTRLTGLFPLL